MKHVLPFLGICLVSICSAQTGTVVNYTKISQTSGNFETTLLNQGRFGYVSGAGDEKLISAAPFAGNGEIHLITLNADGTTASSESVTAADLDIFEGITDAKFGFSTLALGDVNGDGAADYLAGAPGLTTYGALVLLSSSDMGFQADTLSIPATLRLPGAAWGTQLAMHNGEIFAGILTESGTAVSFSISANLEMTVNHIYDSTSPELESVLSPGDQFGAGIALADIDGDGTEDLICGATGDDTGGADFGAVYVVFRESDASIRSVQKIATQTGGFNGFLNTDDQFGVSIASLGDINQDGTPDIAVGAPGDDDGNIDIGAVWIIMLNPNGTVKQRQKICRLDGNFDGDINFDDRFGTRIAHLGDLDGDGVADIAVGAVQDDDGGANRGALFVLNLAYCAIPTADFDYETEGGTVHFTVPGEPDFEYLWNFSDGNFSQDQNPSHTFASSGNYNVCLTIFSDCGGNNNCLNVQVNVAPLSASAQLGAQIKVYPNPARDALQLDHLPGNGFVRLIDLTGRVVMEGALTEGRQTLNIAGYQSGVYILEMRIGKEKVVKRIQIV